MQLFPGEETAHDFLSLRAGGSSSPSFQHRREAQHSSQGYGMEMHRSLKPLEQAKQRSRSSGNTAAGSAVDGASPAGSDSEEHVLPGGIGTFSIRQASGTPSREEAGSHGAVRNAFAPVLHGSRMENAHETGGSGSRAHRAPSTMWQDSGTDQRSIGKTPYEATRAEGRSSASSADQGPSTPRSKHSATEQRRRTKINDRLETLRELLPHSDQKRDKASFLSEVIEYIRFLQEKVQKYEAADPERNHEDSKSMPWAKVYYRSCWRNKQNISQVQGGDLSSSTQDMNNEQYSPKHISAAHPDLFNTSTPASSSHMATGTPKNWENNNTSSNQPWLSMSTTRQESESGNRMLNKHERQTLQDENHSISSAYSQGLFNRLTEALKKSGLDPSQANISVEINMSKRARENTSDNSKVNEAEELVHITKRPRCNKS
ncbi:transcription factor BIM2-like isoform X2 [Oryza brachyantha]|uniref:BHLH domain-containing protein n=1 Tax=Oryza brachyantha TaxID=4533 RepID=J3LGN5_ORYBR|nr:transcription factor BIM2-like isoform X2 [Oryza brachyantha]